MWDYASSGSQAAGGKFWSFPSPFGLSEKYKSRDSALKATDRHPRMAGTIIGSTETAFYVLAVYFSPVAIRRTRHAVLIGIVASIAICRLVFA